MPVTLVLGARWGALMDHLVETLRGLELGPFDGARVLVATHETGRVVGQEVAARVGISAGIDYLTTAGLGRALAEAAGVQADRARWLGSPLDVAVQGVLGEVADGHPLLKAALEADGLRPGRRRATAVRLARPLRLYADLVPDLAGAWLDPDHHRPVPLGRGWGGGRDSGERRWRGGLGHRASISGIEGNGKPRWRLPRSVSGPPAPELARVIGPPGRNSAISSVFLEILFDDSQFMGYVAILNFHPLMEDRFW